ncbi:MAG: hypothetical protein GY906_30000 [bacterium]|nr:hypothetical protein [bacterium]
MRRFAYLVVLLAASTAAATSFDFDLTDVGAIPAEFTVASGAWQVRTDDTAQTTGKSLVQTAENNGSDFNIIIADDMKLGDLEISVRFESLSGREDQGGGPVWRYRDFNNYYIARYNPLEDNFRVYKVVDGRRKMLKSATIKATPGWHEIRVTMIGSRIECSYDGQLHLKSDDGTFTEAGQIGLWTKADAVTAFDDLAAKAADGGKQ